MRIIAGKRRTEGIIVSIEPASPSGFSRNDNVVVIAEDTNVSGQMGRVFSIQDQGRTADVDFPRGGLFRIPTEDLKRV